MNGLRCEICKEGHLVKKDGYFVCEVCGAKYTPEEASKIYSQMKNTDNQSHPINTNDEFILFDNKDSKKDLSEKQSKKKYIIDVLSEYSVPKYCACCMSEDAKYYEIKHHSITRSGNRRATYTITGKMCLCNDCYNHQEDTKKIVKKTMWMSLLTGALLEILLIYLFRGNRPVIILGMLMPILSYILVSKIVKLPALPSNHAARTDNVIMESSDMPSGYESTFSMYSNSNKKIQHLTFTFENKEYAQLFKNANPNASDIQEQPSTDTSKKVSLFVFAKKSIGQMAFYSFYTALIALVIGLMLFH